MLEFIRRREIRRGTELAAKTRNHLVKTRLRDLCGSKGHNCVDRSKRMWSNAVVKAT